MPTVKPSDYPDVISEIQVDVELTSCHINLLIVDEVGNLGRTPEDNDLSFVYTYRNLDGTTGSVAIGPLAESDAALYQYSPEAGINFIVAWKSRLSISALAHECLHLTFSHARRRGFALSKGNEEFFCYFLDHILDKLCRAALTLPYELRISTDYARSIPQPAQAHQPVV